MISNLAELEHALTQLSSYQAMLEAMRVHLQETNPDLFPLASEGYLRHIEELQTEIAAYLREQPAETETPPATVS